jgi:catechol 2,3-dioxygenase-like lactoylglutathione lyase family enzyme
VSFALHHVAITVRDLVRSTAFYEALGFETSFEWAAEDGSRRLRQMRCGDGMVELFAYPETVEAPAPASNAVGLNHIAFATPDVDAALADMRAGGFVVGDPEIVTTPFGARLVFITDPDGTSVELLQEGGHA